MGGNLLRVLEEAEIVAAALAGEVPNESIIGSLPYPCHTNDLNASIS